MIIFFKKVLLKYSRYRVHTQVPGTGYMSCTSGIQYPGILN